MSRFDLSYGSAYPEAFVDLARGEVHVYCPDTAEAVHQQYGGRQYYFSRSGRSGKGWIPASPTIRRCAILRTDESRPAVPNGGEIFPGVRIVVPTTDLGWAERGLLLVARGRDVYVTFGGWELNQLLPGLLRGEVLEGGREVVLTSWRSPHEGWKIQEVKLTVRVHGELRKGLGCLGQRRVLELLFWEELFRACQIDSAATTGWHSELGLAVGNDGKTYHVAGGILRRQATVDRTILQEECPWVFFLENSLDFIVQRGEEYFVVRDEPGEEGDHSQQLDAVEVLEAYRTGKLPVRVDVSDQASLSDEQVEEAMLSES